MNDKTLTAKAEFLVKEARLDAKAFRENTVYNADGDAIRLIANAERLDQYADTIEAQAEEKKALQSRIEALEAALRGLLGNEVAEERIGWRGSSPSNPDLYQCEYCHKEHYDCTEIEHLDDCPILAARKALEGSGNG